MVNKDVLAAIDKEIARLQQARDILAGDEETETRGRRVAKQPTKKRAVAAKGTTKRVLSPEARKRIADAQKKRWAAQKAGK
jgi:hypothetical protein